MNKELLKDRNYMSKLNSIKEVINKNWNQMEKINFALIERTREEMKNRPISDRNEFRRNYVFN